MNSGFDYKTILNKALKYWYLIILSLGIAFGIAYYQVLKETKEYLVDGTVFIEDNSEAAAAIDGGIQGITIKGVETRANELEMLKSKSLLNQVVKELGLEVNYFRVEKYKEVQIYNESPIQLRHTDSLWMVHWNELSIRIDNTNQFTLNSPDVNTQQYEFGKPFIFKGTNLIIDYYSQKDKNPIRHYEIQIAPPHIIVENILYRLQLERLGNSDLLKLSITYPVKELGINIINKLIEVFFRNGLEEKRKRASNTLMFIEERLGYITQELFHVERQAEIYKTAKGITSDPTDKAEKFYEQITNIDDALLNTAITKKILADILKMLKAPRSNYDFIALGSESSSPALVALVAQYNELVAERKRLLVAAQPENPIIIRLDDQLTSLKKNVVNRIEIALQNLNDKEAQLQNELVPLTNRMSEIPKNQRELLQIMRKQQIKETLFLFLLQKREETAISLAAQVGNARTIDKPAIIREIPSSAQRYYSLAGILGLSFPLGLILLLIRLDDKIQSEEELKALTKIPFLGSICKSSKIGYLAITDNTRSAIAEMFRLLRTNIEFLNPKTKSQTIMVTSTWPSEGKSFISLNLGLSMALSGKRTVLVDMDLRKPKLSKYLTSKDSTKGVSNYLVGQQSLKNIITPIERHNNLYLIGSGPIPPNPAELIMVDRMNRLMTELRKEFEVIIIDSPPVGIVADGLLLNKYASTTAFVVYSNQTKKEDLKILLELDKNKKLNNVGLILNGVNSVTGKYNYGYYEQQKPSRWNRFRKKDSLPKLNLEEDLIEEQEVEV